MFPFMYSFHITSDMERTGPNHPRSLPLQERPRTKEEFIELQMQQWRQRCHQQSPRRRQLQHSPANPSSRHQRSLPNNVRILTSPSSCSPTSPHYFIPVSPPSPVPQPLTRSMPSNMPRGRHFSRLVQDMPTKSMICRHLVRHLHFCLASTSFRLSVPMKKYRRKQN